MNIVVVVVIGAIFLLAFFVLRGRSAGQERVVDPVEEAQVYIAYGRYREAVRSLEAHLQRKPDDDRARQLLASIRSKV